MPPDADVIAAGLTERGHALAVHAFETLGSTNAWLATSQNENALCITDHQPAGKGRRGRVWEAAPGNITFSIAQLLPVAPGSVSQVPLVTGLACAEALRSSLGLDVQVKWPNDLLLDGKKLGGLLHESVPRSTSQRIIGGIGVNLVHDTRVEALGIGGSTLAGHGVSPDRRDELVVLLAAAVLDAWWSWVDTGWSAFADRWQQVDALDGMAVRVFNGLPGADDVQTSDGRACGVDASGALQVCSPTGELQLVRAGDVSVRPR